MKLPQQTLYKGVLLMSYKHFTTNDRIRIEVLRKLGKSTRQIAIELNRHHSSIARELKRNSENIYCAEIAHKKYLERRKSSPSTSKYSDYLSKIIEQHLNLTWSPEQISNTVLKGKLCFKTIYRWIYEGKITNVDYTVLRQQGKRQKPRETRGKFNIGTSIHKRPKDVKNRKSFGHWELDSMVSSRGKSKGCFATFIERKSRFYFAYTMPDRCSHSMKESIVKLVNILPSRAIKTMTVDRGKEFSCYKDVESELDIPVYFADAYSAWQRGSNENSNGLLREFYPKKTDLALVTQEELFHSLMLINNRPRKCLGWKSAFQVFIQELSHLT